MPSTAMESDPFPGRSARPPRGAKGARALKERIYASFTGLSIVAGLAISQHSTPPETFLTLAVAVFGISAAGFVADVIAFQISHRRLPRGPEVLDIVIIALSALGSAVIPLLVIAVAWAGVMRLEWALWFGIGIYVVTLVVALLLAAARSGLAEGQRVISAAILIGLAGVVVTLLILAHSV